MWNSNHNSSGPTTVVASQMDASDRAPVFADMGKSPSPDRAHDSGPATKRARLSSDGRLTNIEAWIAMGPSSHFANCQSLV